MVYELQGQNQQALDDLDKADQLDHNNHDIIGRRGRVLGKLGRFDEALKDLTTAIYLSANDPALSSRYYQDRAHVQHSLHNADAALADINMSIQLDGSNSVAYFSRGLLYAELGETDLAIKDNSMVIKLDLEYAMAYYQRGVLLQSIGDIDKARSDFETFLSLYELDDEFAQYAREQLK
jgi:tetratricopeptide (TPR) repeat protein